MATTFMANISATATLIPYNTQIGAVGPAHRGGFIQVGVTSPNNGGGPVYVFESDGAYAQFNTTTGVGTMQPKPAQWDASFYIRFNGPDDSMYQTQPLYDWVLDKGGNPSVFYYACKPLNPSGA